MNTAGQCAAEMPKYVCHKEVWALKIKEIIFAPLPQFQFVTCRGSFVLGTACGRCERCDWDRANPGPRNAIIVPADEGYSDFTVPGDFIQKHKPVVGGYYVVYEDGYKSFSPAKAFEEGYTRIEPRQVLDARRMCPPGSEPLT